MAFEEIPATATDLKEIEKLLLPLKEGKDAGLMSEAGMPAIADPGQVVVRLAQLLGFKVIPLAGPSSLMMALMASGLEGQRFSFHGYLSAKKDELAGQMRDLEKRADRDKATQMWIETPYRNHQILKAAEENFHAQRSFCIAADLGSETGFAVTKKMLEWKKSGWPEIHKIPAVFLIR